jgi:hypothetical protein
MLISTYDAEVFRTNFMGDLIAIPSSIFYQDASENQSVSLRGFGIKERSVLYRTLFEDARVAKRLGIWKPVGDVIVQAIRMDGDASYVAYLNGGAAYIEGEREKDRTFATLCFFDVMVRAALVQGITYHMWLYYLEYICERLVDTYSLSGEFIDRTDEFPTRGSYMLYELIQTLKRWVECALEVPDTSPHLTVKSSKPEHENENIPKSAALCLGKCLRLIIQCDQIDWRFKEYIVEIVVRSVGKFGSSEKHASMRAAYVNAIVSDSSGQSDPHYRSTLLRLVRSADHVL